ncbi:hypothetical protein BN77_p10145 [Rhizobium mesoamericanum STM3625]|uniref:Uncharacterized protein n=1 Tax=Rhizobium mesoamericanum STM3625 TaxID=1211777 RepID=K0Q553_9HYPH|nr:hypothetical protein BN77_p10145 [Rhizobium mesoamericanum STM3625]
MALLQPLTGSATFPFQFRYILDDHLDIGRQEIASSNNQIVQALYVVGVCLVGREISYVIRS